MCPTYTYECQQRGCRFTFEGVRSIDARHDHFICPKCGGASTLIASPVFGIVKNPAVPKGGNIQ